MHGLSVCHGIGPSHHRKGVGEGVWGGAGGGGRRGGREPAATDSESRSCIWKVALYNIDIGYDIICFELSMLSYSYDIICL